MSKKRVQGGDGCTCGTGKYCHVHKEYRTPKSQGYASTDDRELDQTIQNMSLHERCGGGRRVIRGGIGPQSRYW